MGRKLLLAAFILCLPAVLIAGPGTLKHGHVYTGYSIAYSDAQTLISKTSFLNQYLYAEVGLFNRFDLYANIPFVIAREQDNSEIDYNNFGDGIFGIKFGIGNEYRGDPFTLSIGTDVKTPLNHYDPNEHTSPGDAQEDLYFYTQLGKLLFAGTFINAELGYRIRFQEPADQVYVGLEYGIYFSRPRLGLSIYANHTNALSGKSTDDPDYTFTNLETDYTFMGVKVAVSPVENMFVEFSPGYTVYAENAVEFLAFSIHVGYLFK